MSDTLQITSAGVIEEAGYYLNSDGHLSSDMKLQDNHYYQDFSYEIESGVSIDQYRDTATSLLHPVGTKMFGRYIWATAIAVMPSLPPSEIRWDYQQDGPVVIEAMAVEIDTIGIGTRNVNAVPVIARPDGTGVGGWAKLDPNPLGSANAACENGDDLVLENDDALMLSSQNIYIGRFAAPGNITGTSMVYTTNVQMNMDAGQFNSYPLNSRTVGDDWVEGISTQDGSILVTRADPQEDRIIG